MIRTRVINKPLTIYTLFPSETHSPKAGVMSVGDEVRIIAKCHGDNINNNSKWYLDQHKDFIWSGGVSPFDDSRLPLYGNDLKMTFTCDDYGVSDSIDNGIFELAENDKIDSAECFVNGPDPKERIRRLFQLIKEGKKLELGIHLTITSGRPLTTPLANNGFVDDNGVFIDWTKYKKKIFDDGREWLEQEIRAQIAKAEEIEKELREELDLETEGRIFTHLSSHHNSLTFFESGFLTFLKVASSKKYPIRTPSVQPTLKSTVAIKMKVTLRALNGRKLRKLLKDFNRTAEWPIPYMDYLDMRHYGPALKEVLQKRFDKWIEKKEEARESILSALIKSGQKHVEVVLHVRKGDKSDLAKRKRDRKDLWENLRQTELMVQGPRGRELYTGVSTEYFDGRVLEYWDIRHNLNRTQFGKRTFLSDNIKYVQYPKA